MVNGIDRPLDVLNASKGKEILVQLKNNKQMVGKLLAFDIHINIVLDNAKEIENGEQSKSYGLAFVRGDTIIFISPSSAGKN
jgi:small nuclear ribonucleoprotein